MSADDTTTPFAAIYAAIGRWCAEHSIRFGDGRFPPGKAGEFDGLSLAMNPDYAFEERTYYAIHAIGSIVQWSLDKPATDRLFAELRAAKENKAAEPEQFEQMIERYRRFETRSSEFAVWLLTALGAEEVIAGYTNFMRADLEAMTQFHRAGEAPIWSRFFARWNHEASRGLRQVVPFQATPVPPFEPLRFEMQEILQRQETGS